MVVFLCLSCVFLLLLFLMISSKLHTMNRRLDRMKTILEKFKEVEKGSLPGTIEAKNETTGVKK
ncbi:MAG: hypothetical protein A2293_01240 [Elusimicrobia bacterium RIFOXYB2_FULL_49_7]|nr:MAG: hypothetical protein A2293_01240 [Elusimicrobia bacterium RIFOXYB2_FULL_49_7]